MPPEKGFTLIEFLVVISITAIIGAAVLSVFAGGLNVYDRVRGFNMERTEALVSLEQIERDLRNSFVLSGIDFTGTDKDISCAGLVYAIDSDGNAYLLPGKLCYYFDGATKALFKYEVSYPHAVSGGDPEPRPVKKIAALRDFAFSYYYYDSASGRFGWKNAWGGGEGLPRGVKVETQYWDGIKLVRISRIVFIPAAG